MSMLSLLRAVLYAAPLAIAGPPIPPHVLTPADLEAFFDGVVPLQLEQADVAGAVVAVVKDGKVLFIKGYGYADAASRRPVSPESTLFRPGSISKLFTWTAVMQQVEQGKLDLDRDINTYLDFRIPPAFGRPITLRDLMTHRPGFEETDKDLFVGQASDLRPLTQYLPSHLPARIFPAGETPAYSNYGATVAAYIVQRVSGQPFEDYVEQHILGPLQMTTSSFRQPLPAALAPLMSSGYDRGSGDAKSFEYIEVAPAGALATSAADMTHFMIAHLGLGRWDGVQILAPATMAAMHTRQPGWPPSVRGGALGFYEQSRNGHRIIGHGGDTQYFHSGLYLVLDANLGFFISCNSAGRGDVGTPDVVFGRFMDRYFPDSAAREPIVPTALADDQRVAGVYMSSRRSQTNVLAVTSLVGELTVSADQADTTIVIDAQSGINGQPKRYREVAPDVFREVGGPAHIAFTTDSTGRRTLFVDFPFEVFQRVTTPTDRKNISLAMLGASLALMILTLVAWPIAAMVRAHLRQQLPLGPEARRLRTLVRCVCALNVLFAALSAALFYHLTLGEPAGPGHDGDLAVHAVQIQGLVAVLATVVVLYAAWQSWRDRQRWVWSSVWTTGLAVACVVFSWWVVRWHLLNFHLNY
jgi:CubicO group peptidase (beta-lactamase class C family)